MFPVRFIGAVGGFMLPSLLIEIRGYNIVATGFAFAKSTSSNPEADKIRSAKAIATEAFFCSVIGQANLTFKRRCTTFIVFFIKVY